MGKPSNHNKNNTTDNTAALPDNRGKAAVIIVTVAVICIIMAVVDSVILPGYAIKSVVKVTLFLACPIFYSLTGGHLDLSQLFRSSLKEVTRYLFVGVSLFLLMVLGYSLFGGLFDLSGVTTALTADTGVSVDNFVWVSLYISFANSLLEEFFFRGFAFLVLRRYVPDHIAYLFSVTAFALYHVAMMVGWFDLWVLLLAVLGLMIGGAIFCVLDSKPNTVYPSWIVHMFANFAINYIGFRLFGILG